MNATVYLFCSTYFLHSFLHSFPSTLQLRVSFGLLNNPSQFGSYGEGLDSLQYPLHMANLVDTKFLQITPSMLLPPPPHPRLIIRFLKNLVLTV
jgi:hypothetical protein